MAAARQGRALRIPASRVNRFARLGSMATGVAGNMAMAGIRQLGKGARPSVRELLLTPANMRRVAEQLAQRRGAAMKIGQLISMDTGDALPPELVEIFARLRSDAHFMPPRQLKRVLNANWPSHWVQAFRTFDVHPIAAASIGQVHHAQLQDGRVLAIKVQYPGVVDSIDSDVANVGALIRLTGLVPDGFDLAPYLAEARRQLHEETDYLRESQHLHAFRGLLSEDTRFRLPDVHADWSSPAVLAMTYVSGNPIETVANLSQPERDRIATALVALLLREVFEFGLVQTDPNFANYLCDPDSRQIVLLDFGATRAIGPEIRDAYRRLLSAGLDRDRNELEAATIDLGLIDPGVAERHRKRLLDMVDMAVCSLTADPVFDFGASDLPRRMQAEGMALADEGFVPPPLPMDVLYMQRKLGGIFLLASRLRARVPLRNLIARHAVLA